MILIRIALNDFLQHVEGVYKGIDIRTAAVRSNGMWHNALTIVRFSCEDPKDLRKRQDNKKAEWETFKTSDFSVFTAACHIDLLGNIVEFFTKRSLPFYGPDDVHFERSIDILSLRGDFNGTKYTKDETPKWPYFEAFEGQHSPLLTQERLRREVKSQTGINIYELISELLEIRFDHGLHLDLVVNAPFYAIIEDVDFASQNCVTKVKFHKDVSDLAINVFARSRGPTGSLVSPPQRMQLNPGQSQVLDEQFRLWTNVAELPDTKSYDQLFVELTQTKSIGLDIDSHSQAISEYLKTKKPESNPLLAAFSRFCPDSDLEGYITNPGKIQPPSPKKPSSAFEGAVSWILALCGFQSIWLGWSGHETLKEGKTEHLRLDILGQYQKENTLLLVNCTIGDPLQDIDKLATIRHKLSSEVFKDTNIQLKAFIFSSQQIVTTANKSGKNAGVKVFGAEDIRIILNYLRKREIGKTLTYLGF